LHNRKTLRAALITRNIHAFARTICAQNAEIVMNGAPTVRDIHQFFGDTMNAALPAQALKETAAWDNPMGLMGFEFVEFTSPQPGVLEAVFEKLGFTLVAKHRSKDVVLYRQNGINFILNREPHSQAAYFGAEHGPSACGLAFRVKDAHKDGMKIVGPGSLLADPVSAVSMSLGLVFGTAGLPHILMRFFTVPNAVEARKSVFVASGFIGLFFLVVCTLGLAAISIVGSDPQFFEGGKVGGKLIGGGNMPVMHLANAVGGNLYLGFMSAVAFATILAVVSGLALAGASAIAHDIYARVIRQGKATEAEEMRVSRWASLGLGVVAVVLGIAFEKQNVAFLVGLTFGIAASTNFPILILSMYWKGLTTRGALIGGIVGLVSAVTFVVLSKAVWVVVLNNPAPIFPYEQPALFSMPLAFFFTWLFSVTDKSARAKNEIDAFDDQYVRSQTGIGAAAASNH
jgi:cation/acetate symporter